MKKLSLLLSGFLLLFLFCGCTSVKRFKSVSYEAQDNTLVDMDLFGSRLSVEEDESPQTNLWDLNNPLSLFPSDWNKFFSWNADLI